ncbi:MAG: TIGR04282 family arsenosugar biosynthesis glycosyltransferase [Geobacteraceae bacterium]|nr:TIGR04282 family arsenosugar biosynthesis glycosyltransferase [Geobacteraceae bacterium]
MTPHCQHIAVALFVRHPVPGRVKTRLACDLGDGDACDLYRAIVADIIENIKACDLPLYVFHDGAAAGGLPLEWLNAAEGVISQAGDSLGERMTAAFEYLFSIGRERVVLAGSDIPGIDAQLLRSAIASIAEHEMAFSPAFDGGYGLVASNKEGFRVAIFQNIPWSTSGVLEMTLERCQAEGVSYTLLDPRQDIDTLKDIEAYCGQPSSTAVSTNGWLVSHGFMLPLMIYC